MGNEKKGQNGSEAEEESLKILECWLENIKELDKQKRVEFKISIIISIIILLLIAFSLIPIELL